VTVKEHLDAAIAGIEALEPRGSRSEADRELSLAITHIEDAQMRVTRGLAKHLGKFAPADLEK
jgi:hypothetical protein